MGEATWRRSGSSLAIFCTLWLFFQPLELYAEEAPQATNEDEDEDRFAAPPALNLDAAAELAEPVELLNVTEARRHFEQGVALFQEDDVEAALAEFRASYRMNPIAQVLFNIAVSLRRLHRYAEAADTLRTYLREGTEESEERRFLARDLIAELEAVLAHVTVEVDQEEADLFIDGELLGRTPLEESLRLAAGEHDIEIRLDGYRTHRERLEVHGGQQVELTIELEEVSTPWYRQWWLWTIVGAVVVGTTVGLAVGLTAESPGTEFDVMVGSGGDE